jgi:hypothetical protein
MLRKKQLKGKPWLTKRVPLNKDVTCFITIGTKLSPK